MDDRYESVRRLAAGIRRAGWGDVAALLLEAVEPLAPLGAQVLRVLQPGLSLLVAPDELAALADRLEEPGSLAVLRRELSGIADEHREGDGG